MGSISIPVGKRLLSSLVRTLSCVGLRARTGSLCLCDRRVSGPLSRHRTESNRETQRTSQVSFLPHHRALVEQLWFWVVWVVLSVLPSRLSPFSISDRFFYAF